MRWGCYRKTEFESMYGYWFMHIFSWAMSSFGIKNMGVVLQEIKLCRVLEITYFYYKSKDMEIVLISFCVLLCSDDRGFWRIQFSSLLVG